MNVENPSYDPAKDEALKKESEQLNKERLAVEEEENAADSTHYNEEARRELEMQNGEEQNNLV
ncbi:MAG: hypothetical protein WCP93_04580 [Candidatus Berkelbacteria bacterium]